MNIMKNGALLLFIILILGLMLCSFLGGNCSREGYANSDVVKLQSGVTKDSSTSGGKSGNSSGYDNYDHYSGTSAPTKYYGPNGSTAMVTPSGDGSTHSITVTNSNGQTTQYTLSSADATSGSSSPSSSSSSSSSSSTTSPFANSISSMMTQFANKTFNGPNGGSARLFTGKDGQYAIEETQSNGNTTIYTASNTYTYTYNQPTSSSSAASPSSSNTSSDSSSSSSASPFSDYFSNTSGANTSSANNSNSQYNSSLPQGIPGRMIPPGQEDLYILKSEVVPPVCPACPTSSACPRTEKPPPCPACARCPEPSFECKKVPNYNAANSSSYLPIPVLSNFSSFGM